MWIGVISLFPDMFRAISDYGVTARAVKNGLLNLHYWNPRDFTTDRHRTVDDRPYGGGPGMLMMVSPLRSAILAAKAAASAASKDLPLTNTLSAPDHGQGNDALTKRNAEKNYAEKSNAGQDNTAKDKAPKDSAKVICLSPQGRKLSQQAISELAQQQQLILLCGRYEGIDERLIRQQVDEEWSIGDYVLTGGELPAMVLIDAVARFIPGVLGHEASANEDSFASGLLDCPHYTRPELLDGEQVPEVLLSGNHAEIKRWRLKQSLGRTWLRRPDLLANLALTVEQTALLNEFREEYQQRQ